jgi:hypothetical protein
VKALIIREPWIGLILQGSKIWEMRRRPVKHRGPTALIRAGSGLVVGQCDLTDALDELSWPAFDSAQQHHGIPAPQRTKAYLLGWRCPWVLSNARAFAQPVPYRHPQGAVVWVNLSPAETLEVLAA